MVLEPASQLAEAFFFLVMELLMADGVGFKIDFMNCELLLMDCELGMTNCETDCDCVSAWSSGATC